MPVLAAARQLFFVVFFLSSVFFLPSSASLSQSDMHISPCLHTRMLGATAFVYLESRGHTPTTARRPRRRSKKGLTFPSGSKLER